MSLINDALKKAQQKRAEDAAAQTPPAPPARPEPDTISQPHPEDLKPRIPAPPPPANRPQLPIPPPRPANAPRPINPARPANLPPIVNYSIPQIEPAEQPATPKAQHRVSSSIRYNPSGEDENPSGEARSGGQKTFWIAIACIAVIAIVVRLVVTLGRDDETASRSKPAPPAPLQTAVALPTPTLPPPSFPPTRETPAAPPESAAPAALAPVQPAEPPPTVSFPAVPKPTAKPAPAPAVATRPAPAPVKPAEPAPVVSLPAPAPAATTAAAQPALAPTVLPPIYAPRAPAPVNNATRIQNFIDRLRVTSVRISEKGSKVILNDRLFSVGEMVDTGLELKLVKIEPGVITFSDPGGKKYIKLYQ